MDMESIVDRRRKELVYPPGSSYAASSGGRLAEIREMCSAARVKNYHKRFYHLDNMVIFFRFFLKLILVYNHIWLCGP